VAVKESANFGREVPTRVDTQTLIEISHQVRLVLTWVQADDTSMNLNDVAEALNDQWQKIRVSCLQVK
jgi:hypothetical protein